MEEWKSWCRLCACNGIHKVDMFYRELGNGHSIAEELTSLCNLKFKIANDLPSKICTNCNLSFKNMKYFVENLIKTQEMFIEFLSNPTNNWSSSQKKYKLPNVFEIKQEDDFLLNTDSLCKNEFQEKFCIKLNGIIDENSIDKVADSLKRYKMDSLNCTFNNYEEVDDLKKSDNFISKIQDHAKKCKDDTLEVKRKEKKNPLKFQCKMCEKKCGSKGGLTFHMKKKHFNSFEFCKINDQRKVRTEFWCKVCGKDCINKGSLAVHLKFKHQIVKDPNFIPPKEKKDFFCPHCDRKFTSQNGRWSHIYTIHDSRMKVICEECGKEFSTKDHLLKHKIIHTQKRMFHCPHCPASFKGKSGLGAHVAIHGESFPCSLCGVVLNTKSLLKRHMIVHSDIKNFKCNFCNKHFKRSQNLYSHIITHVGTRTFECIICNQHFEQDITYKEHLNTKHPKEFAKMLSKGERIPRRNFLSSDQLKAINEAAKNS